MSYGMWGGGGENWGVLVDGVYDSPAVPMNVDDNDPTGMQRGSRGRLR